MSARSDLGFPLGEETTDAHQGPGRAQPRDHMRHLRKIVENLRRSRQVVRLSVRGIAVLIKHDPVRMLCGELLGDSDRLVGPPFSR